MTGVFYLHRIDGTYTLHLITMLLRWVKNVVSSGEKAQQCIWTCPTYGAATVRQATPS